ncbi:oxidoreductase [Clostridia bacterium]|nr:oxidoreductase [Clostridia bacterium]
MVRWGIIGCGDVTEVKSGPAFQLANDSSLTMVMRRNAALCEDYARRHSVPRWTTNARELIESNEVDAVYVATPPSSHMDYALAVLTAGKPVYVEKPMAMNHAECLKMIQAAKETGIPAFVAYYRRRLPYFLKIKSLIDEGAIGDIRSVRVSFSNNVGPSIDAWRLNPAIAGGGLLLDVGSHTLDILDYLVRPIVSVKSHAANLIGRAAVEDTVCASWQFANGALGVGYWRFDNTIDEDDIWIEGSEGSIRCATFTPVPILLKYKDGSQEQYELEYPKHVQLPMIQHVTNCLHNLEQPVSTFETAARTSWVIEQMLSGV